MIPGTPPGPAPKGEGRARRPKQAKFREGECPREGESQESQEAAGPWKHGRGFPTGMGIKPLQRGRARPAVWHGGHRGRGHPRSGATRKAERPEGRQYRATRRSRKATGHGRGTGEVRTADRQCPIGSARPSANRRKGCDAERRTRSMPGQALKGKPRGRARMKQAGEIVTGARRRSRLERQGRNRTRRRQLRERWLVTIGLRRGGTNLERAGDAGGRRRG
jgi:hypothetical protein